MNIENRLFTAMLSCAATVLLLVAPLGNALAQSPSGNEARGLEEIIVTARKREESLQDTPVVISALSAETLSNFSIESVEDIANFTPGLVAESLGNPGGGILFLRGVGSGALNPSVDQAVSLVIDDMQIGNLNIQHSAMIDMQSVQVYKGPQALFFGKNSPGGVLSIKTADPGDEFEAQLKAGYEVEAEQWFVQGVASGPISDKAAGRLVVRHTETESGIFDVDSGNSSSSLDGSAIPGDSIFARGTLVMNPTDDLTIRAKLTYSDSSAAADGKATIQRVHCPLGAPQGATPFECELDGTVQYADLPQSLIDFLATQGIDTGPAGAFENEQLLATVALDYNINDELTLSSVSGYYDISNLGLASISFSTDPGVIIPVQDYTFDQFTQELRLKSEFSGPVNFVAGVFYEQKENASVTTGPLNVGVLGGLGFDFWTLLGLNDYVQEAEAMSAFLDLTWNITDKLELSGGLRYSYEEKEFKGIIGYTGDAKVDWDDISPQATLSWDVNDEWLLFASYREGFKSGGFDGAFSPAPVTPVPYEPETVKGFEIGAKGTLFDNTLQLNAAIFSYQYDDMQLNSFNSDSGTVTLTTLNAAEADLDGVEVDFVWITPIDGLQARGAITYLDAEFVDYVAPCVTGQSIAAGCNLNFANGQFNSQDLAGEPLNLAAEYVATLGLAYEQTLDNVLLGLSLDATYSDDYVTSATQVPGTAQDSHTKVNVAIRLSDIDDTWSVALIARNLTDEYTGTEGLTVPFTGFGTGTATAIPADSIVTVSPGRTFTLQFEYNFR